MKDFRSLRMLLRSLRHPSEGKSAEESAQFFFGRWFELPIPRFKIFFRDTEDRFCSDHLISFFQSFPEEFERAVHKMDFEIGSDFRRLFLKSSRSTFAQQPKSRMTSQPSSRTLRAVSHMIASISE